MIVTLEHAFVARETMMWTRRSVQFTVGAESPLGQLFGLHVDRVDRCVDEDGHEHVAERVEGDEQAERENN